MTSIECKQVIINERDKNRCLLASWVCPVLACLSIIDIDFTSYEDKYHFVLKGPNPCSDEHQEDNELMAWGEGWQDSMPMLCATL
jgi:hypothetical protein